MLKTILHELKSHAPFTLTGAMTGIILMVVLVLAHVSHEALKPVFESCHALHVFFSAIVTAAMFRRYRKGILAGVVIGYVGSIGIGTLSDIVFPYLGGALMGGHMHFHLAFIDHWWLINPAALLGIAIGLARPITKVPHSAHVLLSTWASLFYLMAHAETEWSLLVLPLVLVVLFVAVWLPCCVSDIAFPLLFIGKGAHLHAHGQDESQGGPEAD